MYLNNLLYPIVLMLSQRKTLPTLLPMYFIIMLMY